MKVEKYEDGLQIEVEGGPSVLVTIRQHPHYGFRGSVVTQNATGDMEIVDFHGDGLEGVVSHGPVPYVPAEEED